MTKKVYICGVDYQHEIGETAITHVYDSVKSLKRNRDCWEQCGIVEVEIKLIKWVEKQDFSVKIEE